MMRGRPVDTAAPGTPKKNLLGQKDVFRYPIPHRILRARLQQAVAGKTTPEKIITPSQIKLLDNQAELLAKVITFNKNKLRWLPQPQAAVPG